MGPRSDERGKLGGIADVIASRPRFNGAAFG